MPPSLIHLPPISVRVADADEEIFLIYSEASTARLNTIGLGSVDSHTNELDLSLEITPRPGDGYANEVPVNVDVRLAQDLTGLRSRKGDTGSVIWRASVEFAKVVLQDILFPPRAFPPTFNASALKQANVLELGAGTGVLGVLLAPYTGRWVATDLEELVPLIDKNLHPNLGGESESTHPTQEHKSGTRSSKGHKPHTKRPALHSRTSRDSSHSHGSSSHTVEPTTSARVQALPLDWFDIHRTPPNTRARTLARGHIDSAFATATAPISSSSTHPSRSNHDTNGNARIDLILAVDTLYNPSLVAPFLSVLDEFASPPSSSSTSRSEPSDGEPDSDATLVVVVSELRDEDVLREFLDGWLALGGGEWEIWRIGGRSDGSENDDEAGNEEGSKTRFLDGPFVAWAGWKTGQR